VVEHSELASNPKALRHFLWQHAPARKADSCTPEFRDRVDAHGQLCFVGPAVKT
jgi:hypothetical protein